MADDDDPVWKALADPTRRALLDLLRNGPKNVGELASGFEVTRFAVMKHLRVLIDAGLVVVQPRGRERLNFLNPLPIRAIHRRWVQPFEEVAADRLLDLKRQVEHGKEKSRESRRKP